MNDKDLADAAYELLDTNLWDWDEHMNTWCETHGGEAYASIFVRDWRVAGALIEKAHSTKTIIIDGIHNEPWIRVYGLCERAKDYKIGDNLCRSIVESLVVGLTADPRGHDHE